MTIVGNKFDGNLKVIQHKLLSNFLIEVDHKAISRQIPIILFDEIVYANFCQYLTYM